MTDGCNWKPFCFLFYGRKKKTDTLKLNFKWLILYIPTITRYIVYSRRNTVCNILQHLTSMCIYFHNCFPIVFFMFCCKQLWRSDSLPVTLKLLITNLWSQAGWASHWCYHDSLLSWLNSALLVMPSVQHRCLWRLPNPKWGHVPELDGELLQRRSP